MGAKAWVRLGSALAQGGSPAAHGKRSVCPERVSTLLNMIGQKNEPLCMVNSIMVRFL